MPASNTVDSEPPSPRCSVERPSSCSTHEPMSTTTIIESPSSTAVAETSSAIDVAKTQSTSAVVKTPSSASSVIVVEMHDTLFKAEVIHARECGMSVAYLIERYRTFNVDKTKFSKWMKKKNDIVTVAVDIQFKELKEVFVSTRYKGFGAKVVKFCRSSKTTIRSF